MSGLSASNKIFSPRFLLYALAAWMLLIAVFTVLGNAASDIWLVGTIVIFIAHSAATHQWQWLQTRWFQLAIVFWIWLVITSLLSQWPESSIKVSLPWIRFPLFAIALPILLGLQFRMRHILLASLVTCLLVLAIVLVFEKINNPGVERLYGVWSQDQSPKAGWLVAGFGLPVAYWALSKMLESATAALWALPLVAILVFSATLTGEIYITLSFLLGIALFLVACRMSFKLSAWAFLLGLLVLLLIIWFAPETAQRFQHSLTTRLPWMPSSDYYTPWMRGLAAAELNPFLGIGAKNHMFYCEETAELLSIGGGVCFPHPHQLYIQIAAETGGVGLFLFLLMVAALIYEIVKGAHWRTLPLPTKAALCLVITVLWPISTYSHAFGQHRNFFTWFAIAWALSFVSKKNKTRGNSNHPTA